MGEQRKDRRKDRRRDPIGRVATVKDGYTVSHLFGPGVTESVLARLIDYFNEHEAYCGETIYQNADAQYEAAVVLADIAEDILCFKVTDND